jgi:1-acyl-sn-glycerol-3-phosphate acyltransferase
VARDESISSLVDRLELPFNALGIDPYGISKSHLRVGYTALAMLYRHYFRVKVVGIENVPARGRAMLVGNHSGGVAIDGAMVIASMLLEMEPPRLAHAMADKFLNRLPIASTWTTRTGQFTGLPENAERLLRDDRLLVVFPEGHWGTAKLYPERYSLVNFGSGFVRLALKTQTPIIPFGFLGGGSAVPSIFNSKLLGRLTGTPYVPLTPYGLPVPLPVPLEVRYGAPIRFEGTGDEEDAVIITYVAQVKGQIAALIEEGRKGRRGS